MRKQYELTDKEEREFNRLGPFPGEAWKFWQRVAHARGLDYRTIMSTAPTFTAMPEGHGQHWCAPMKLRCMKKPQLSKAELAAMG